MKKFLGLRFDHFTPTVLTGFSSTVITIIGSAVLALFSSAAFAQVYFPRDAMDPRVAGQAAVFSDIPAAETTIGSIAGEGFRHRGEGNERRHRVRISRPFQIQTTEVTVLQYFLVTGRDPVHWGRETCERVKGGFRVVMGQGLCTEVPANPLTFGEIQDFLRILNREPGEYEYRLPTESEWEFASRGGTSDEFSRFCGSEDVWQYMESGEFAFGRVASAKPNGYGLFDVYGNVSEMVSDFYDVHYGLGDFRDPIAVDPMGPATGTVHVLKSGPSGGYSTYSAAREPWGQFNETAGFRLVRTKR